MNIPPANPLTPSSRSSGLGAGFLIVSCILLVLAMCVVGVTGYFRLGSETTALRRSFMSSVPGTWNKKIAIHVGALTTALIRNGSRLFHLPPEPRAALDALHGAEVGIYELKESPGSMDSRAIFKSTDAAMKWRGWDRIVGVAKEGDLVAVYFPHRKISLHGVKCCVLVLHERQLVVTSVRGDLEPLLKLADTHLNLSELKRHLPEGI